MNVVRNMLRVFMAAAAIIALLTSAGYTQQNPLMPSLSIGDAVKRKLTPEEEAKQKQLDDAYRAATKKIPDQNTTVDPWANVRPAPATAPQNKTTAQNKKQQ